MKDGKGAQLVFVPRQLRQNTAEPWQKPALSEILVRMAGFFLARAVPFGSIAPFGVAFLAMERRFSLQSLVSFLFVSLGYFSLAEKEMFCYIGACAMYEIALFFFSSHEDTENKWSLFVSVMVVALFDITRMFWTGIGVGEVLRLAADCSLTGLGVLVFDRCRGILEGKNFLTYNPSQEEKLAVCMMCGIGLLSFQSLPIPFPFSLSNVLGLVLSGAVGVCSGVLSGVAGGLAAGLVLGLGSELLTFLAILGCCGFACGLARRFGKWGAAIAMALTGISLCAYAMLEGGEAVRFYEVPVAAAILGLLPPNIFATVGKFTEFDFTSGEATQHLRTQLQDRLSLAANSFENLAQTFVRISDKQIDVDLEDVALLFDTAAERVCGRCNRVRECWQIQFSTTYKTMFRFLEILERKGVLEKEDAGERFLERCPRHHSLIKEINRLYEIYKINQVWKSKLCENRELVSQQFHGMAETLRRISHEVSDACVFDHLAEDEILSRLHSRGVDAERVWVIQPEHAGRSVQIQIRRSVDSELRRTVCTVLKGVLGIGFLPARDLPSEDEGIRMQFYEMPRLLIETGCASTGKRAENGDSYTMNCLQGGKFLATLSDGMGSGSKAKAESETIITLLEDFMEAGFDKKVAVTLINSVMVMKSANEAFATVDMCMMDLNTGEAEFIKNGAEASYIKRGNRIETIRSASLPVGVLSQVEIETFAHKLGRGDMVVMLSDGLELKESGEGWIRQALKRADTNIPAQELADSLMEQAIGLKGGVADDDMTVMVLKVG